MKLPWGKMTFRGLVIALALLAVSASDSWGQSQHPPQTQRIKLEQQSDSGRKIENQGARDAQNTGQPPIVLPEASAPEKKDHGGDNSSESAEGGTEYYVFYGYRFKITDILIVIFTGLLVVTGCWQGIELNRTVSSIIRQERPFLRPTEITSFIQAGDDFEANKTALMSYRLENYGRTPAILTEFRAEVVIRFELPNPMKTQGLPIFHQEVVTPDKPSREFYGTSVVDIGDRDKTTLFKKTAFLYFIGFVRYRDVYDRKRITAFCWQYDYATDSFFPVRSKRHNYTK
jgi:hypothetical protein